MGERLNSGEIRERISQLDNWELEEDKRISKSNKFKNSKEAGAFTKKWASSQWKPINISIFNYFMDM